MKEPIGLADVMPVLRDFLMPPVQAMAAEQPFSQSWPAGGPWQDQDASAPSASQ